MAPTDRFVAETTFYVRYAETDAMGIVHHASYIVYFEEGRSHFTRVLGRDYADFEREGFAFAVTEVHARYGVPARYGQRLTVRCWIVDLRTRAVTFGYEIVDSATGIVHVTAETRHVCVTREGAVTRIPDDWRALMGGSAVPTATQG